MKVEYFVVNESQYSKRRSGYLTLVVITFPTGERGVATLLTDRPLAPSGFVDIDIGAAIKVVPYVKAVPVGTDSSQVGLGTEELTF